MSKSSSRFVSGPRSQINSQTQGNELQSQQPADLAIMTNPIGTKCKKETKSRRRVCTCNSKQIKILQHSLLPTSKQNRQIPIPWTLKKSIKPLVPSHPIQYLEDRFRRCNRCSCSAREGFVFLFGVDVFVEKVSVYTGYCEGFCCDFDVV